MTESVLAPIRVVPWYREITAKQWYALLAGQLGWALDAFDVMLYTFCLTPIMAEWNLRPAAAGFMVTLTLLASSAGGILFGGIADRIGRKRALMITVLVFSVCSGLSGLAQNLTQLAIARALLGLGMGGEWASGALLVSETWPAQHRGKAIGLMQAGWSLGYIAAAIAAATILPRWGWHAMFFLGIAPALFTLWIRRRVDEPAIWLDARSRGQMARGSHGSFLRIFEPAVVRYTLLCTLTCAFVMFGYWGLFSWMPGFLAQPIERGGAGLGVFKSALWVIPVNVGALIGYVAFGFFADKIGRRPTFAAYLVMAAILVCLFGRIHDETELLVIGPLIGFFGSGYFSLFGAFVAELFPTSARGAAVGFCYNCGRALSAFAPTIVGLLSSTYGLGGALTFLAIAYLAGAVAIFTLPETRGRQLT